jgi:hypothetical protein
MEEYHHCVIAGNPGIGKSTIGRMLMCHYLRHGYTPVVVLGDISDAWTLLSDAATASSKFVIFYDDFLGTFRFDEAKFAKNEDTSLMRFVEKARRSPAIRFILTTREMIFADRSPGACTALLSDRRMNSKNARFSSRTTLGPIGPGSYTTICISPISLTPGCRGLSPDRSIVTS